MLALWLSAVLSQGPVVTADEVHLVVGRTVTLARLPGPLLCDDATLIALSDDGEGALVLTGARSGQTRCGFSQFSERRVVFTVEVKSVEEAVAPLATKIVGLALRRLYTHAQ